MNILKKKLALREAALDALWAPAQLLCETKARPLITLPFSSKQPWQRRELPLMTENKLAYCLLEKQRVPQTQCSSPGTQLTAGADVCLPITPSKSPLCYWQKEQWDMQITVPGVISISLWPMQLMSSQHPWSNNRPSFSFQHYNI